MKTILSSTVKVYGVINKFLYTAVLHWWISYRSQTYHTYDWCIVAPSRFSAVSVYKLLIMFRTTLMSVPTYGEKTYVNKRPNSICFISLLFMSYVLKLIVLPRRPLQNITVDVIITFNIGFLSFFVLTNNIN